MTEARRSVSETAVEALDRARTGQTLTNYPAIFGGFMAKGIPEADIKPRENVFTFQAWKALGRSVKRGEHGVRVVTFITCTGKPDIDQATGEEKARSYRRPWTTTVFHISQTEEHRPDYRTSKSPDGSVTYRVEDPPEGHIAAVTVGKNRDGSYWAVIEFRSGVGPGAMRWDCPHWPQLLADIDRKRMEYHCPLFDIEEPAAAHW